MGFLDAIVWEPDHSKGCLLELENRYGLSSEEVYLAYKHNMQTILAPIQRDDLAEWIHHYEIFKATNKKGE